MDRSHLLQPPPPEPPQKPSRVEGASLAKFVALRTVVALVLAIAEWKKALGDMNARTWINHVGPAA